MHSGASKETRYQTVARHFTERFIPEVVKALLVFLAKNPRVWVSSVEDREGVGIHPDRTVTARSTVVPDVDFTS